MTLGDVYVPGRQEQAEFFEFAVRVATARLKRERDLPVSAEDIANQALANLVMTMKTTAIGNPKGFLTWKIKNLIIDAGISREAELRHMAVVAHKAPRLRFVDGELVEVLPRNVSIRGLSAPFIAAEDQEAANIWAAAVSASMPDQADRHLLRDRFYNPDLSITELARRHGNKSPNAMANHLKRILGDPDQPGAVECVSFVIGQLSHPTARVFTRILMTYDELDVLTDPLGAAVGHLEYVGTRSPEFRKLAAKGIARLQWMSRHRPSNRGLANKLLNRLITAACFYVLEVNDARHDVFNERGLVDDIKVLDAVYGAIRAFPGV